MANGYENIVRRSALDLAEYRPSSARGTYRRPAARYNRPRAFNPNLDLNDQGSANEQRAAARAEAEAAASEGGNGETLSADAGPRGSSDNDEIPGGQQGIALNRGMEVQREYLNRQRERRRQLAQRARRNRRQSALPVGEGGGVESTGLAGADIDDVMRLSQIARGEAPEQVAAVENRMRRMDLETAEREKAKVRGIAQGMREIRNGIINGEFKRGGKEGTPGYDYFLVPERLQHHITDMTEGAFQPKLDRQAGTGSRAAAKTLPVYVHESAVGNAGQPFIEFYQGADPVTLGSGEPLRVRKDIANQFADIADMDARVRAGWQTPDTSVRDQRVDELRSTEAQNLRAQAQNAAGVLRQIDSVLASPQYADLTPAAKQELESERTRAQQAYDAIQQTLTAMTGGMREERERMMRPQATSPSGQLVPAPGLAQVQAGSRDFLPMLAERIADRVTGGRRAAIPGRPSAPDYTMPPSDTDEAAIMALSPGQQAGTITPGRRGTPPPEAIVFLRQNDTPEMRQWFIEMYGALPEGF